MPEAALSDAAELRKLVKQLQSVSNPPDIIAILNTLKTDFQVNEAILRESKAGLAVGKLRTHATKEVADLAKEVVKKWKSAVEKAKSTQGGVVSKVAEKIKAAPQKSPAVSTATPTKPGAVRTAKSDGVKISVGDTTRDKCVALIYDALATDSAHANNTILERAIGVEKTVFKDNNNSTTMEYKSRIRVLFVNLKDKHNPSLRNKVLDGDLGSEKLARMTTKDMASEERKLEDSKMEENNLFKSLGAGEPQAETDAFQCGRCKQRKTRYRQAQTRSADEPMTTFVTCVNCGYRWKFS
ncbi:transcription elongation factor [Pluteus cervinus]|uniref:Transcription elongation factor n=1 Tax=Pluteus cervinus TaxID=181527 RepID=A0ACD3ANL9_9AGAR|nr:transcription elongation factor [Pluteus cervinus]